MAVTIRSYVPAYAGGTLTDGTQVVLLTPPTGGTGGTTISDVVGLQAVLDSKLNDVTGVLGNTNVTATGNDINLLTGTATYGLVTADLNKLADVTVSASEINSLTGVTGDVQVQLDAKLNIDGSNTMTGDLNLGGNNVVMDVGGNTVLEPAIGAFAVRLNGATEYNFSDSQMDVYNKPVVNVTDPVNPQDVATKNYVDGLVSGPGAFLPVDGSGTMTGNLDLDGNQIIFSSTGNVYAVAPDDLTLQLWVNANPGTIITDTTVDVVNKPIINVTDPTNPQDAATRNYIDANYVPASGGDFTGTVRFLGFEGLSFDPADTNTISDNNQSMVINGNVDPTSGNYRVAGFASRIRVGGSGLVGMRFESAPSGNAGDPVVWTNNLSMFNGSNTMDVPLQVTTGSAAAPSYSFIGDTDTGMFWDTVNNVGISAGGVAHIILGGGEVDVQSQMLTNVADPLTGDDVGDRDYNDTRYLQVANDLSDVNAATARTNLGLVTVANTGDYNDLINLPTIPTGLDTLTDVNVGTPGPAEDGWVLQWNNGAGEFDLVDVPIDSVFGRTGAVVAVAGDYSAAQITFTPVGDVAATDVQAAIAEVDAEKLALTGGTMTGDIDMGGNDITNIGNLSNPPHQYTATEYTSTNIGNSFFIRTTGAPTVSTPTYSFATNQDTGMLWDGSNIVFTIGGSQRLGIGIGTLNVGGNRVTNVGNPTAGTDAVNLNYLNGLNTVRLLGSVTGLDLLTAGTTPIYTVPVGNMHVITQIIVRTTSFVPGVSPVDPDIVIGTLAPFDDIISAATLSWGPGGAGDQAIYLNPDQGATTPNSGTTITLDVTTSAGGTFTALDVDVYVLGLEM